jgi:hypothetical protein
MIDEVKLCFLSKNKAECLLLLKKIVIMATQNNDFEAAGASFIIGALIELYNRDFSQACEYLMQLVLYSPVFDMYDRETLPI